MMELTLFKFFSALGILLITIIAGWWPIHRRWYGDNFLNWPLAQALSVGVFLGAGLLHLLGDAVVSMAQAGYQYPLPIVLAASAFGLLFFIEHILLHVFQAEHTPSRLLATLALIMLSLHSMIAGSALGINAHFSEAVVIFIAIISHKWAESFAMAVVLTKSGLGLLMVIMLFFIFALMTPVGIGIGEQLLVLHHGGGLAAPVLNSLAAGTFIYLGTLHNLKDSVMLRACQNPREFTAMLFGFGLMAVVAIWV